VIKHDVHRADDDAWMRQVESLYVEMQQDSRLRGLVSVVNRPAEGEKGSFSQVLVDLHQSGALEAAVAIFALWLRRDRRRRIILRRKNVDDGMEITLDASSMSDASAAEIAKSLAERL
jgi:Effector Associated Constant Component 1